jgi:hypothetical protein
MPCNQASCLLVSCRRYNIPECDKYILSIYPRWIQASIKIIYLSATLRMTPSFSVEKAVVVVFLVGDHLLVVEVSVLPL